MLKKILFGLIGLIVLLLLVSFLLPSKVHIERSLIVNAPAETVFDQVNDLQKLVMWMPWLKIDKTTKLAFGKQIKGKGASYTWNSNHPDVGSGTYYIAESKPYEAIHNVMDFKGEGKATGSFKFKPANNGIKVTWAFDTDIGSNPIEKYKGLMMDRFMGASFEEGLDELRNISERVAGSRETAVNQNGGGQDYEIKEIDFPGKSYIAVRKTVTMREVDGHFAFHFQQIYDNCREQNIRNNGVPSGIFYDWNDSNGTVNLAAAIPVKEARDLSSEMKALTLPPSKAIIVDYYGDPSGISGAHLAAQQYMERRSLNAISPTLEEYYAKPDQQPDPAQWLTRLYFFYR